MRQASVENGRRGSEPEPSRRLDQKLPDNSVRMLLITGLKLTQDPSSQWLQNEFQGTTILPELEEVEKIEQVNTRVGNTLTKIWASREVASKILQKKRDLAKADRKFRTIYIFPHRPAHLRYQGWTQQPRSHLSARPLRFRSSQSHPLRYEPVRDLVKSGYLRSDLSLNKERYRERPRGDIDTRLYQCSFRKRIQAQTSTTSPNR